MKFFVLSACLVMGGMLIFVGMVATFPPHLQQEFDALNYHLTLPRQHLILQSFQHIPWAADDLFLLPLNFALAPYWFVTELPSRFPQYIFLWGILLVSIRLTEYFIGRKYDTFLLLTCAILGSHAFGIQMGTAMLDIVICYLGLAALDSYLRGHYALAVMEFTFFFWSKGMIPLQMIMMGVVLALCLLIARTR